jgi:O-antigen/teichoic acid export membrane protein
VSDEPESRGERATRAARSTIVLTPLIALVGLIGNVFVLRALSPSDYALFATALAIRVAIQFLVDMGTGTATSRAFAEFDVAGKRPQARTFFARLMTARVGAVAVVAIAVALLPGLAADALGLHDNESSFLVFMVLVSSCEIISGLGTPVLMGTYGQPRLNKISLVQSGAQSVLVIGAAAAGLGLDGILAALVVSSVLKAVLVNGYAWVAISHIADAGHPHEPLGRTFARVATSSLIGKLAGFALSRPPMTLIAVGSVPRPQVAVFSVGYDFAHQVLLLASAPLYSLLMPSFSGRPFEETRTLFRTCTRSLAIAMLPAAAVLLATWPALVDVIFGTKYHDTSTYAAIIVPLLALEITLNGPPTALMLTSDRLVGRYLTIKLVTLLAAAIPLWLSREDLLAATACMMGLRVASALALQVVARRAGVDVQGPWLLRLALCSAAAWAAGTAAAAAVPNEVADLVVGPGVAILTVLALIRAARLFNDADAEVVARVVPPARRWLARLVA